jgi:hypothetical protein
VQDHALTSAQAQRLARVRRVLEAVVEGSVHAQRVLDPGQLNDHLPQAEQTQPLVGLAVLE